MSSDITVDVLIVGSGPVGATFARKLVEHGRSIYMVEMGPQMTRRPGEHIKNAYIYQRNIDQFASVIRGHLNVMSVPTNNTEVLSLDPGAFRIDDEKYKGFVRNNQNPDQDPNKNLPAAAVTYGVGGMATHWTCATPRHHATMERSDIYSDAEWDRLYGIGETLLNTHNDQYEQSMRHTAVKETLLQEYPELPHPYQVQSLPLGVVRRSDNPELVHWTGTDDVFGALADGPLDREPFILKDQHRCTRLVESPGGGRIDHAVITDLQAGRDFKVTASLFIVCANAYCTPQILHASGIRPEPLGRWLTEQPVSFCQIVLKHDIVENLRHDPRFRQKVEEHRHTNPEDPIPIPTHEPEPNVWIPVSEERPWHCQIHRDAFHYGDVRPNVDSRLIVDLRWFGIVKPAYESRMAFSDTRVDVFGMPQPRFEWVLDEEDSRKQHHMMKDMLRAANALGGFLPGSEPQFVAPGLPLHVTGTTRMGTRPEDSVVDQNSKVWGFENLYLGGNGLIPRGSASNPTLTSVAMAWKAAESIVGA